MSEREMNNMINTLRSYIDDFNIKRRDLKQKLSKCENESKESGMLENEIKEIENKLLNIRVQLGF
jgi:hypothetical protein